MSAHRDGVGRSGTHAAATRAIEYKDPYLAILKEVGIGGDVQFYHPWVPANKVTLIQTARTCAHILLE